MDRVVQRALSASVTVDNQVVSSISNGILDVETLANRILKFKVWDDDGGRWKRSVLDNGYQVLLVSQFTLLANTKKGNKPDFHGACPPVLARDMYAALLDKTRELYIKERKLPIEEGQKWVQDGVFGAMMQVALVNDGPVTFEINTRAQQQSTNSTPKVGTPKASAKEMVSTEAAPSKVDEMLTSQS
ncbi:D-Tyr tRNAtyr deacylase-like domain-containing protein [Sphaerosporella brunnea]|uniref:D-aminoacyl-tRNA deacylase n=1 Tax=Sphaerosporella brunnea TaxID=1250544 RepID=A0A5J5F9X2_9PEZI|nr:D-Tyr tRNAtyr deacylase-like domain-containing protein [Sphaerosporella brunnea]